MCVCVCVKEQERVQTTDTADAALIDNERKVIVPNKSEATPSAIIAKSVA